MGARPDYDFGAAPQLFNATVRGVEMPLIGAGQKSGYLWVMDRRTGEQVWNTTVGYGHVGGGFGGLPEQRVDFGPVHRFRFAAGLTIELPLR